eukprot:TRINITY_DN1534_c1_g2_i3.p1 TRINITY_DN1534_c1_g2~~TRINITY_DN1534_c1_g2_i3.p1  ORF type:complete len:1986 (+),score=537.28 TRINITY_DN1534_c1_g2_i3:68-6025(+)
MLKFFQLFTVVVFLANFSCVFSNTDDSPVFTSVVQTDAYYRLNLVFSGNNSTQIGLKAGVKVKGCQNEFPLFDSETLSVLTNDGQYAYSCTWINPLKLQIGYNFNVDEDLKDLGQITLSGEAIKSDESSSYFSSGTQPISFRKPAPEIDEIESKNYGSEIEIEFTAQVYPALSGTSGGSVSCEGIIENANTLLGVGSMCRMSSRNALTAEVKPSGTIEYILEEDADSVGDCEPGKSLNLLPGNVLPVEGSVYSVSGCVNVIKDQDAVGYVELIGPLMVGTCDEMITLRASVYNVGIHGLQYRWEVEITEGEPTLADRAESVKLKNVLVDASTRSIKTLEFESKLLGKNLLYTFGVTVTINGVESRENWPIYKSDKTIPKIVPDTSPYIEMKRVEKRTLKLTADAPSCLPSSKLTYNWNLASGTLLDGYTFESMLTNNPKEIVLNGEAFEMEGHYEIEVLVAVEGQPDLVNIAIFDVEVEPSPLNVTIGSVRTITVNDDLELKVDVTDPDKRVEPFEYQWECFLMLPDDTSNPCLDSNGKELDLSSYIQVITQTQNEAGQTGLKIPAGILPACEHDLDIDEDYVYCYEFRVVVSKGVGGEPDEQELEETTYPVYIHSDTEKPKVYIKEVSPVLTTQKAFVVTNRLILRAYKAPKTEIQWYLWGDQGLVKGSYGSMFVIDKDTLTAGSFYCAYVLATNTFGASVASQCFQTNQAPTGGVLEGNKRVGLAFTDTFGFETSGWNDGDMPLSYKFVAISLSTGSESVIRNWSSVSYCNTMLGVGKYRIKVYARDTDGAVSSTESSGSGEFLDINVTDIQVEVGVGGNRADSIMGEKQDTMEWLENVGDADQIMLFSKEIFEAFDDPCVGVFCDHGTCDEDYGECVCDDGYSGDYCSIHPAVDGGPSESWSEWSICDYSCGGGTQYATRSCDNPSPQNGGAECNEDDLFKTQSCNTETCTSKIDGAFSDWVWEECVADCSTKPEGGVVIGTKTAKRYCNNPAPSLGNGFSGKTCFWVGEDEKVETCEMTCEASIAPKSCPGSFYEEDEREFLFECTGNGSCLREKRGVEVTAENCLTNDFLCTAKCVCDEGYSGQSCKRSTDLMSSVQTNSKSVLNMMKGISGQITSDNLADSVDVLAMFASEGDIFDAESLETVEGIMDDLFNAADEFDSDISLKMLTAIDSMFSYGYGAGGDMSSIATAVDKVAQGLMNTVYPGQGMTKMSTTHMNVGVESRMIEDVPTSEMEISNSYGESTTVNFPEGLLSDSEHEYIKMKGIEWMYNPYTASVDAADVTLDSRVTGLTLTDTSGTELDISGLDTPIEFKFTVAHTNIAEVECTFYDSESNSWSSKGCVLSGLEIGDDSMVVTCSVIHLTDFAGRAISSTPTVNVVDPVGDADLLLDYNLSNSTPLWILGGITSVFVGLCFLAGRSQKKLKAKMTDLQKDQFLKHGKMMPVRPHNQPALVKVISHLRREHRWASYFGAPLKEQIALSRFQRLATIIAMTYTVIAVNAAFYGQENVAIETQLIALVCSILAIVPSSIFIPFLFRRVNEYKSMTLRDISESRDKIKAANKDMKRRVSTTIGNPMSGQKRNSKVAPTEGSQKIGSLKEIVIQVSPRTKQIQEELKLETLDEIENGSHETKVNETEGTEMTQSLPMNMNVQDQTMEPMPVPVVKTKTQYYIDEDSETYANIQKVENKIKWTRFGAIGLFMMTTCVLLFGFMHAIGQSQEEDFGLVFVILQLIILFPLILNSLLGFFATKNNNMALMELQSLLNWALCLILLFFAFVVGTFKEINLANDGVEYAIKTTWTALYNESEDSPVSEDILIAAQEDNNCCGWTGSDDMAILPCPTNGQNLGCRDSMVNNFQSANIWFMYYGIILMVILGISIWLTHKIRQFCKQVSNMRLEAIKESPDAVRAATLFQSVYRGWRARIAVIREIEVEAWAQLRIQRQIVSGLVYGLVFFYSAFMLYINMIYGKLYSHEIKFPIHSGLS